jgi:hypothetical protein
MKPSSAVLVEYAKQRLPTAGTSLRSELTADVVVASFVMPGLTGHLFHIIGTNVFTPSASSAFWTLSSRE